MASPVPQIYGSRYYYEARIKHYPFGNRPPVNYLEYTDPGDAHEPSIMVPGCGDFRSVSYTIWKSLNPDFPIFGAINFALIDKSPAVLAKNVLILYMCLTLPVEKAPKLKRLQAMWSIWCCYELLPEHASVLKDTLKTLLRLADDWFSDTNPLYDFISFSTASTLAGVKKIWALWQTLEVGDALLMAMREQRQKEEDAVVGQSGDLEVPEIGLFTALTSLGWHSNEDKIKRMAQEYEVYMLAGTVYAEVLTDQTTSKRVVGNPTMFADREEYIIHTVRNPFCCFQHMHFASIEKREEECLYVPGFPHIQVSSDAFEKNPLLANSFQQFALWISCTSDLLKFEPWKVSIKLACMDVLEYFDICSDRDYDVIFASNMIDHIAPPALVVGAARLLDDNGIFVCGSVKYRDIGATVERFIESVFGFPAKYLPVICGIRCVNHEGEGYSSLISTEHACIETDSICAFEVKTVKHLFWKKTNGTHLTIQSLSEGPGPEITMHLSHLFWLCSQGNKHWEKPIHALCIDSGIKVLLAFAAQFDAKVTSSHLFWSQLCADLHSNRVLRAYTHCIQAQALVSGLHLHLTVDKSTCPLCADLPLSGFLGQFRIAVPLEKVFTTRPYFGLFVNPKNKEDGEAQTVDCIHGEVTGDTLTLSFIAPLRYVRQGSTFIFDEKCVGKSKSIPGRIEVLKTGKLRECLVSGPLIPRPDNPSRALVPTSSSLGVVTKHFGNGDSFETTIRLAAEDKPDLLTAKLDITMLSDIMVQTVCSGHSLSLEYPYPVANHKLHLARSRRDKTLTIKAHRLTRQYEEDGPLFYVNPEDHFSLPAMELCPKMIEFFSKMQYSLKIRIFYGDKISVNHSMLEVEYAVKELLTRTDQYIFSIESETGECLGVIEVIHWVLDMHRKVPAVYLSYALVNKLPNSAVSNVKRGVDAIDAKVKLQFSVGGFKLFERLLTYFNTHNLSPLASKTVILDEYDLEEHCMNAVVYPFYQDPCKGGQSLQCAECFELVGSDRAICVKCQVVLYCSTRCRDKDSFTHKLTCKAMPQIAKLTAKVLKPSPTDTLTIGSCSYCKKKSSELKSCAKCRKTAYCGRECQKADWKTHKSSCAPPSCSNCKATSSNLKKCTGCEKVSYCSKQCQVKHWSKHKKECSDSTKTESSATKTEPTASTSTSSKKKPEWAEHDTFLREVLSRLIQPEKYASPQDSKKSSADRSEKERSTSKEKSKTSSDSPPEFDNPKHAEIMSKLSKESQDLIRAERAYSRRQKAKESSTPKTEPKHTEPAVKPKPSKEPTAVKSKEPAAVKPKATPKEPATEKLKPKETATVKPKPKEPTAVKSKEPTAVKSKPTIESTALSGQKRSSLKRDSKKLSASASGDVNGNGQEHGKGSSKKLPMTCGYCQKKPTKPQRCARCHKVVYCGQECQRAHWKAEHKLTCNTTG